MSVLWFVGPGWLGCQAPVDLEGTVSVVEPLPVPPEGEGYQMEMTTTASAGEETWACAVYKAPNAVVANVNWVEFRQTEGMHHLTLSTTLAPGGLGVEPGVYACDEIYSGAFMEEQVMMFGDSGNGDGILHLPEGVAAIVPPSIDIVHEVHFVNTSDKDVTLTSMLNIWTIPDEDVLSGIWGGSVRDENLHVPPNSTDYVEWTRCEMNVDVDVLFLASHMHERGVEFTIAPWDGASTGEVFFTNDDWHDPKITQYDPPISLKTGEGFEFTCHWTNPDPIEVNYGLAATDEMCNMAIVHTPMDFSALCKVVETSDGVVPE